MRIWLSSTADWLNQAMIEVSCLYRCLLWCNSAVCYVTIFYYSGDDVLLLFNMFTFHIVLLKLTWSMYHYYPADVLFIASTNNSIGGEHYVFGSFLCVVSYFTWHCPQLCGGGLHFDSVASRLTCSVWSWHSSWVVTFSCSIIWHFCIFLLIWR